MDELMQQQNPIINEMCNISPLRDRRIFLNEDINDESLFKLLYWLERLERFDEKIGIKKPIEIVIDTDGGDAVGVLAVISKIESMKENGYKIITTARTHAYSGGFWLLICGSERRAYKNTRIMVHNILSGTMGRHQDMIDDLEDIQSIWIRLKKVVTKYTNITDKQIEELKKNKRDWYFWGDEAIEQNLGVIDKLI